MRVLLVGAAGFIGHHLLHALRSRGHEVRAVARRPEHQPALSGVEWIAGSYERSLSPDDWLPRLAGVDVVVNAAGIIREVGSSTFDVVHAEGPIALFDACRKAGIGRVIQISAIGTDEQAASHYHRSKKRADDHLAGLDLDWLILRPSFVYGAGSESMALFKALARLPITPVVGDGRYEVQPVHIDDLVRASVQALEAKAPTRVRLDVVGGTRMTFDAMLGELRRWWGLPAPGLRFHAPLALMRVVASFTDLLGRGPITREELGMLLRGAASDVGPFEAAFGFHPRPFSEGLAEHPPTEQDRWHASLLPLRPLIRASVAFIWIATGLVSAFVYPPAESFRLLAASGVTGKLASAALYGTSLFEIALGLTTLVGYRARLAGFIQLALVAGFTAILSATQPEFWLHPFGPLTKNVPLVGATLAMMALED